MTVTTYVPRFEPITGANLSGNDGDSNRQYSILYTPTAGNVRVFQGQVKYVAGSDYSFSGTTITFLVPMMNSMDIEIYYEQVSSSPQTSGLLKYSSTQQLAAVLNLSKDIPSWDSGTSPVLETIGTGDNSTTTFYTAYKSVLSNSYTFYYGASASSVTALTENTHYTLVADKGKITLTAAGVTLVGTNKIFGEYSYASNNVKDSFLNTVLGRAETQVDKNLNTTFTDGSATNPSYPVVIEEEHDSQGLFNRVYFTSKRPIIDVSSTLAADITSSATSLAVKSGDGANFPSSGRIIIDNEIISYTSISTDTLSGLTRGIDGTAAAHSAGAQIHTTIVEVSSTEEGGIPTWYPLLKQQDVEFNTDTGKIYIYGNSILSNYIAINGLLPKQDVMVRFKVTYLYGYDFVPDDITRLTLLYAQQMLFNDTIMSSLVKGRDEFRPELMQNVQDEIDRIVNNYRALDMQNT